MGSGHRSGRPEGRTAPPRGSRQPPTGVARIVAPQQQRAEPTGRAAEEAFHHPANEPARDEKQTQPDPHQRIHQLQQGRGVSKAVEREEGLQGHHAHTPHRTGTPQVRHVIMGSLARHGFAIAETDIRVSLASGFWMVLAVARHANLPASTLQVGVDPTVVP